MELLSDALPELQAGMQLCQPADVAQMLFRFIFNFLTVGAVIRFFYYPKSRRRDYFFTFSLINISVFLLVFLLGSVKLKIGFALGIFAIFGIIRYRTESVPIREMTYLFIIIAMSVINALSVQFSIVEMLTANCLFLLSVWLLESRLWMSHTACKLILYDRIDLIRPDMSEELRRDIERRTGLHVLRIEVGHIDFLRDAAMLSVYYKSDAEAVETMTKLPVEKP